VEESFVEAAISEYYEERSCRVTIAF